MATGVLISGGMFASNDYQDGGAATITGTIIYNGYPASRRVRLYDCQGGRLIRETWSDASTGVYSFTQMKDVPYYVWADDFLDNYDPVTHFVANS